MAGVKKKNNQKKAKNTPPPQQIHKILALLIVSWLNVESKCIEPTLQTPWSSLLTTFTKNAISIMFVIVTLESVKRCNILKKR